MYSSRKRSKLTNQLVKTIKMRAGSILEPTLYLPVPCLEDERVVVSEEGAALPSVRDDGDLCEPCVGPHVRRGDLPLYPVGPLPLPHLLLSSHAR